MCTHFTFYYDTELGGSSVFEILTSDIYRALDKWYEYKGQNNFKLKDIKIDGV